jgi:riboflavin synthase
MFTGLVEALGSVVEITPDGNGRRLVLREPGIAPHLALGESVAVNGACLTVVAHDAATFTFGAGPETLRRTSLGDLRPGDRVNLERSLRMGDRLGGHMVTGHIDGLGAVAARVMDGDWLTVWFTCPADLAGQMVSKGSVAVDGVSLTLVDVERERFSVALIPHTLEHTTLGFKDVGSPVNLESDLLAKYVWKCLQLRRGDSQTI